MALAEPGSSAGGSRRSRGLQQMTSLHGGTAAAAAIQPTPPLLQGVTTESASPSTPHQVLMPDLASRRSHRFQQMTSLHGGTAAAVQPPPQQIQGVSTDAVGPTTPHKVLRSVVVLGLDLKQKILEEVDDSVDNVNEWLMKEQTFGEATMRRLGNLLERLIQIKTERFLMVKNMASSIVSYWDLLSTSSEERRIIINLLYYIDVDSAHHLQEPKSLSLGLTKAVENELNRLAHQGNDLVTKKKGKLMEISRATHSECNFGDIVGTDTCAILGELEAKILAVKKDYASRRPIVMRVEQLENALQEIKWYIAYTKQGRTGEDDRVTTAQGLIKQFPKMIEALNGRVAAWNEKGVPFLYDGVDVTLVAKQYHNLYESERKDIPFSLFRRKYRFWMMELSPELK